MLLGLVHPTSGTRHDRRRGVPRPRGPARDGRRRARGDQLPPGPVRAGPPPGARRGRRHPGQPRGRDARPDRHPRVRPPPGRRLLDGHAAAARPGGGAAGRPAGAHPRRARQRARPRGHPVAARVPAAPQRRPGQDGPGLQPPAAGGRADRRRRRHHRQRGPGQAGHDGRARRRAVARWCGRRTPSGSRRRCGTAASASRCRRRPGPGRDRRPAPGRRDRPRGRAAGLGAQHPGARPRAAVLRPDLRWQPQPRRPPSSRPRKGRPDARRGPVRAAEVLHHAGVVGDGHRAVRRGGGLRPALRHPVHLRDARRAGRRPRRTAQRGRPPGGQQRLHRRAHGRLPADALHRRAPDRHGVPPPDAQRHLPRDPAPDAGDARQGRRPAGDRGGVRRRQPARARSRSGRWC